MQSQFPLGASTSPTHSKWNHYRAARIIINNQITRLWTTTKTPELIPSSGYLIIGLLSGRLLFLVVAALQAPACRRFFAESGCVTHISKSSEFALQVLLHLPSSSLGSALLLSFLKTAMRYGICAVYKYTFIHS